MRIFFETVIQQADANDNWHPCYIQTTPGWVGSSGKAFPDTAEGRVLAFEHSRNSNIIYYTKLYNQYNETREKIICDDKSVTNWVLEDCEKSIARFAAVIKENENLVFADDQYFSPAYLSVGIFFEEAPSEKLIALMKERAYEFAELYKETKFGCAITITGFRLLAETITEQTYPV